MCKQVLQNRLCATAEKTTTRSSGEAYGVPGSDLRYLKASDCWRQSELRPPPLAGAQAAWSDLYFAKRSHKNLWLTKDTPKLRGFAGKSLSKATRNVNTLCEPL